MKHINRLRSRFEKEGLDLAESDIETLFAQGWTSEQILARKRKKEKEAKEKKDKP